CCKCSSLVGLRAWILFNSWELRAKTRPRRPVRSLFRSCVILACAIAHFQLRQTSTLLVDPWLSDALESIVRRGRRCAAHLRRTNACAIARPTRANSPERDREQLWL